MAAGSVTSWTVALMTWLTCLCLDGRSEENVEEKADELKEHLLECDRETPL
jgi:hypothetical protein